VIHSQIPESYINTQFEELKEQRERNKSQAQIDQEDADKKKKL
jgi:hypothetical protein